MSCPSSVSAVRESFYEMLCNILRLKRISFENISDYKVTFDSDCRDHVTAVLEQLGFSYHRMQNSVFVYSSSKFENLEVEIKSRNKTSSLTVILIIDASKYFNVGVVVGCTYR